MQSRQVSLARRPVGIPRASDFAIAAIDVPEPRDNEVLVQSLFLSVDPYMRGRMRDVESYTPPFEVGAALSGGAAGRVLKSRRDGIREGDLVVGSWGWQDVALVTGGLRRIDPAAAPISLSLGLLGMTGMTAYFGLTRVAAAAPSETVVISAAAGAVGSAAVQIARILGCRVVGIAGGAHKAAYVRELGAEACVDYRSDDVQAALKRDCPQGVDAYFENVGGPITEAVLPNLNKHARIAVCGQISTYNDEDLPASPKGLLWQAIVRRLRIQGFLIGDFAAEHAAAAETLAGWYREGKLTAREHIVDGLENIGDAFIGLFRGDNIGKLLVRVSS